MKPVTVINRMLIKPGKMDEFVDAQRNFASNLMTKPSGLIGGRLYSSIDGKSALLVSKFESESAQEELRQSPAFKQHLNVLKEMVESASPTLYEEAYTTGDFK
jgi:quinol monooxygenase YgiN